MISPVYAQGFVKQYTAIEGLITEGLSGLFRQDGQAVDYGIGTLEKRGYPASSNCILPVIIYILFGAGALVFGVVFCEAPRGYLMVHRVSPLRGFASGICVGAADLVPGISGGTVALILGIYEQLIDGLRSFDFLKIMRGQFREGVSRVPF